MMGRGLNALGFTAFLFQAWLLTGGPPQWAGGLGKRSRELVLENEGSGMQFVPNYLYTCVETTGVCRVTKPSFRSVYVSLSFSGLPLSL